MYLLPLVGTLFSGLFSGTMVARYYGQRGSNILNIYCMAIAFISSLIIWYEVVFGACEVYTEVFGTWFSVGTFNVCWSLYYDLIAVHLLLTVTSVSFAVHCYALVYMKSDPHLNQFMCYLSLFTFFMCVLVTGQDLIVMLVGWEGIQHQCPNDKLLCLFYVFRKGKDRQSQRTGNENRNRFFSRMPAVKRIGSHTSLFKQIMIGFLLPCDQRSRDGWLELHGQGARLGISLSV